MNAATNLIPLSSAVILRGQRAWSRIKTTAAEQRQLWREVGEALLEGRRENPSNQAFGAWCKEHGFDMHRNYRSAAMWMAQNWSSVASIACNVSDPIAIQAAHRDLSSPSPVNPDAEPDAEAAAAPEVLKNHRRYKAVLDHSKGTGPEAETAKRQLKATAKKLGITEEALERLVDKLDPYGKLLPAKREGLKMFMDDVLDFTKHLRQTVENFKGAVTPEFLIAVISNELKAAK